MIPRSPVATLVLAALLLCPTVTRAALSIGDTTASIEFQETRHYTVHVPPGYDGSTPVPLVIDLHAYTSNPAQQKSLSGFDALSDLHGFLVAYPEGFDPNPDGLHRGWNVGSDPGLAVLGSGLDDVGFVRAVVADIRAQANIDATRIYATGVSNGGGLAHRLACEASDLFAGVAPVALPLTASPMAVCQPLRPVPVFAVAGLTDLAVPYEGGLSSVFPEITFAFPAAQDSFAYWAKAVGCGDGSPDTMEDLGSGASCESHTMCLGAAEVALCSIHGTLFNGHLLYSNSDSFAVAERAWDFLSPQTRPAGFATPSACAAAKIKAAGKAAACLVAVNAKGAASGAAPDETKKQKCRDVLSASFTKAETKPPCPTTGDAASIEDRVETLEAALTAALAPAPPTISSCGAAKLKAAAVEAKCLATLRAKQVQKAAPPAAGKVDKCVVKAALAFVKAEAAGDCMHTGDAPAVQADVGVAVTELVCRLVGECP